MNVKKAIKRIGALAAGATMVTATILGASANLGDYPAPFVENYVFDGKIVVGATAATSDVLGAIDIAASLQAAAKSPASSSESSATVTVTGGVQFETGSEDFNLGDNLQSFYPGGTIDDADMELLADGIVEDDGGSNFDFEQSIIVGDYAVDYDQDDNYGDDPVFHLDVGGAGTQELEFRVHFKDTIDASALDDSETIEMFGMKFTFDPDNANGDDFVLFGSDVSIQVNQGEPVTVEVGGEDYTIEILGGNSDNNQANIRVTGDGTSTKSLTEGDSRTMAGLELYVEDVFINNIGENSIAVSLFVGSNKVVIPDASTSYTEIELNGETDTKIYGKLTGTVAALTDIYFQMNPTDFQDPALDAGDEYDWIVMGSDPFVDPLFGFKLNFDGMMPSMDSRETVELTRSGSAYSLGFMTNGNNDITLELYEAASDTNLDTGDDNDLILAASNNFAEDKFFILNSDETKVGDRESYIFEVRNIDNDADRQFTLRELGGGDTTTYDDGDEIEDTGIYGWIAANAVRLTSDSGNATATTSHDYVVAKDGLVVTFGAIDETNDNVSITFLEDSEDIDEQPLSEMVLTISTDATDDIVMASAAWNTSGAASASNDNDVDFDVSPYGTWVEQDSDNGGDYFKVYYSGEETDFNVFLEGPDAVVVRSGSSDGNAYLINEIGVGVAVLDTDAMGLIGRDNLLVVGGPCVNTVAMSLMGNPEVCTEGFAMGKGMLKFFSSRNALLVAGYSADDTLGAAYVLADYANYDLSGDEMEVITTDLTDLSVVSVN